MRDGLMLAEQPFRSGLFIELRNAYGINCERIAEEFRHDGFGWATRHR